MVASEITFPGPSYESSSQTTSHLIIGYLVDIKTTFKDIKNAGVISPTSTWQVRLITHHKTLGNKPWQKTSEIGKDYGLLPTLPCCQPPSEVPYWGQNHLCQSRQTEPQVNDVQPLIWQMHFLKISSVKKEELKPFALIWNGQQCTVVVLPRAMLTLLPSDVGGSKTQNFWTFCRTSYVCVCSMP